VEPLLTTFIAAGLGEFGDKTQLLVVALAARYGRPGAILAGVAAAALANSLIAAAGGIVIHDMITLRAISLLVALALLFAGAGSLISLRPRVNVAGWKTPAFVTAAGGFFIAEFGDKTQFLTAALAAQYDSLPLAALGAATGIVVASAPAAVLGPRLAALLPLTGIRIGVACLFLVVGFIVAVSALRLT
jgi:putative Ca2+/H+ antiporter (TMEM165/GDT1 family)